MYWREHRVTRGAARGDDEQVMAMSNVLTWKR